MSASRRGEAASGPILLQEQDRRESSPCREATTTEYQVGFPIRTSLDQSLFPAPQSLTQGTTSFIASYCQGIHQTPFSRLI